MDTVVVKFGGTSVADAEARACAVEHVKFLREEGLGVVVVVSAMGRKGAPYATDTLLSLVRANISSSRTRDLLLTCGETISACVFADLLEASGIPSMPMNGMTAGIQTDGVYNAAEVTGMDTSRVKKAIENGFVPVITGFQGVSPDLDMMTLGRGGSDTSGVVVGGYLGARDVYIFTDVPGVAEADPRIVPEARFMAEIDCDDMLVLARWGAGVVHPRAVEAGKRFGVPVWVRSTFDYQPGTVIRTQKTKPKGLIGIAVKKQEDDTAVVTMLYRPMTAEVESRAAQLLGGAAVTAESECIHATVAQSDIRQAVKALYTQFAQRDVVPS